MLLFNFNLFKQHRVPFQFYNIKYNVGRTNYYFVKVKAKINGKKYIFFLITFHVIFATNNCLKVMTNIFALIAKK